MAIALPVWKRPTEDKVGMAESLEIAWIEEGAPYFNAILPGYIEALENSNRGHIRRMVDELLAE
jgi:hypothetical protein